MLANLPIFIDRLDQRRRDLAMTYAVLAERSGVSEPTIKRILGGHVRDASFGHVAAVATALGVSLEFGETDLDTLRQEQARKKAVALARLVQGTSALESQAVDSKAFQQLVEKSYHELLAGPARRLWSA